MIFLGEAELVSILGISRTGPKIFGRHFESLKWSKSEALTMLFGVRASEVSKPHASFPIKCLTPGAHVLAKIIQFNFLPQGGHYHMIKLDCMLLLYAMFTATEFNLANFLLHYMIMPCEQLAFPCLLTKIFMHYEINLTAETSSVGMESFGSSTINRMFLPRNDFNKIANEETEEEKDARLKKHHHGQIARGKKKKIDIEEKEAKNVSSGSQ